jgi:hypothetical protein
VNIDIEAELDTLASGSATEEVREMARRAVLVEVEQLRAIETRAQLVRDGYPNADFRQAAKLILAGHPLLNGEG